MATEKQSTAVETIGRYFLPYQVEAILDEARLSLWQKSIRIGATYCLAFRAVRRRMLGLGNYLHTSVNERIAKSFVDDCKRFCKIFDIAASDVHEFSAWNPLTERQESAFEIRFPNDYWIKAFSSNPDALRGEGGEVGIDELTSHKSPKEMLKAAGGRAMWGYPVTIWTSHKGEESEFNRMIKEQRALGAKADWKIRSTDLETALNQGLLDKINEVRGAEFKAAGKAFVPQTREDFIRETKALVGGEDAYLEECMLQPRKGGASAIKWNFLDAARESYPIHRVHFDGDKVDLNLTMLSLADAAKTGGELCLGYDVARTGDLASIWVNQKQAKAYRLRALITLRNAPFRVQKSIFQTIMNLFPSAVGAGDKTGMGMQVCEELAEEFGEARFVGINFGQMKPELGTKLVRVYEDGRQILPAGSEHDEIIYDLAGLRTEPLPSGRTRFYESPNPLNRHSHCDMAWSNALSVMVGEDEKPFGMW